MLTRISLICAALTAVFISVGTAQQSSAPIGPEQPIPYSHKHHVGTLKLKCNMCHANKDPGETMGLPAASVCMSCHQSIKTDSPAIQKLAAYAGNNRPVRWVRVYQIPTYVFFSHRAHLETKNTCQECHGDVASLDVMAKLVPMNMSTCMNCHKEKNASNDCTFCHEQRNQ